MAGDADLVTRLRAGDATAREELAAKFRDRIARYLMTMIGDPHVAEDLTQECIAQGFAKIDDLRDPAAVGAWLYSIAVNLCRQHLRRQVDPAHPTNSRSLETDPAGARRSILSAVVAAESAEAVALAMDRLPILLREALVLHLIEGLPYAEIAGITGATVEALHVRAHRAKALLRKQLGSAVDTFWLER